MRPMRIFCLLPVFATAVLLAQPARHPLTLDDLARFRDVRDPQCSPDGQWVAYTVTTTDVKEDKHDTDVIIYPNETHGIQRPSYQRDRMERYLAWYDKYLKKSAGPSTGAGAEVR